MAITTFRVNQETKEKLNHYTKLYNQKSVSDFVNFMFNYIERNEIDLNLDLNNGTYNTIKEFDNKINVLDKSISNLELGFEKELAKKSKRVEHLISIVMNIEKEYFLPMKKNGMLEYNTENEKREDLVYKKAFQDFIEKVTPVFSDKRKKYVYFLDVEDAEYQRLLNYAR